MKATISAGSTTASGFSNGGFYGINVQPQNYTATFFYRQLAGASVAGGQLYTGFRDSAGQTTYGAAIVDVSNNSVGVWSNYSATIMINTAAPSTRNIFFIEFPKGSQGDFEFNLISCFPPTFKNRTNGARRDIAQAFADIKPGFVRLPGGNDLEGQAVEEHGQATIPKVLVYLK
jgi:alpha-N-arabinofuranosidase